MVLVAVYKYLHKWDHLFTSLKLSLNPGDPTGVELLLHSVLETFGQEIKLPELKMQLASYKRFRITFSLSRDSYAWSYVC